MYEDGGLDEFGDAETFDLAGSWAARQLRLNVAHRICLVFAYATGLLFAFSTGLSERVGGAPGAAARLFLEQRPVSAVVSLLAVAALIGAAHLSVEIGHEVSFWRGMFDIMFAAVLAIAVVTPVMTLLALPVWLTVFVTLAAIGTSVGLVLSAH